MDEQDPPGNPQLGAGSLVSELEERRTETLPQHTEVSLREAAEGGPLETAVESNTTGAEDSSAINEGNVPLDTAVGGACISVTSGRNRVQGFPKQGKVTNSAVPAGAVEDGDSSRTSLYGSSACEGQPPVTNLISKQSEFEDCKEVVVAHLDLVGSNKQPEASALDGASMKVPEVIDDSNSLEGGLVHADETGNRQGPEPVNKDKAVDFGIQTEESLRTSFRTSDGEDCKKECLGIVEIKPSTVHCDENQGLQGGLDQGEEGLVDAGQHEKGSQQSYNKTNLRPAHLDLNNEQTIHLDAQCANITKVSFQGHETLGISVGASDQEEVCQVGSSAICVLGTRTAAIQGRENMQAGDLASCSSRAYGESRTAVGKDPGNCSQGSQLTNTGADFGGERIVHMEGSDFMPCADALETCMQAKENLGIYCESSDFENKSLAFQRSGNIHGGKLEGGLISVGAQTHGESTTVVGNSLENVSQESQQTKNERNPGNAHVEFKCGNAIDRFTGACGSSDAVKDCQVGSPGVLSLEKKSLALQGGENTSEGSLEDRLNAGSSSVCGKSLSALRKRLQRETSPLISSLEPEVQNEEAVSNSRTDLISGQSIGFDRVVAAEVVEGEFKKDNAMYTPNIGTSSLVISSSIEAEISSVEYVEHMQQRQGIQGGSASEEVRPSTPNNEIYEDIQFNAREAIGADSAKPTSEMEEDNLLHTCMGIEKAASQGSMEAADEATIKGQNTADYIVGVLHTGTDESTLESYMDVDKLASQHSLEHVYEETIKEEHTAKELIGISHLEKQVDNQTLMGEKCAIELDGVFSDSKQSAFNASEGEVGKESHNNEKAEPEEEHSAEQSSKRLKECPTFAVGDLVWAKVKSHPWWPGQVFDSADASGFAKKVQKSGRVLVAFFGDGTFGWLQQSQLIAFRPNFKDKVKQTTMKSFCKAVAEALDEVCRRAELGLHCSCHEEVLHSTGTFPDSNTGILKGVRIKSHREISVSKGRFQPEKTLKFVKGIACLPFGSWSSSLEDSELRGHVYGFRTSIFGRGMPNSDELLQDILIQVRGKGGRIAATTEQSSKLKRKFSALETESGVAEAKGKEAKKANAGKDEKLEKPISEDGGQSLATRNARNTTHAKEAVATVVDGTNALEKTDVPSHKEGREGRILGKSKRILVPKDIGGSKKPRRSEPLESEGDAASPMVEQVAELEQNSDNETSPMVGKGAEAGKSSDDGAETLMAIGGFHSKLLKKVGKGNLRDSAIKTTTDAKSGSNKKVDRRERREVPEVKPSQITLDIGRPDEEGLVGHDHVASKSSLVMPDIVHMQKDSEHTTKFHDDTSASPLKDVAIPDDLLNIEKSPVPLLHPANMQEERVKGEKQASLLHSQQGEDAKKTMKSVKLGECIQRIAGELTPLPKNVDESPAKKTVSDVSRKSGFKKEKKSSASEPFQKMSNQKLPSIESANEKVHPTCLQLLQGLRSLARNPLNNTSTKKPLDGVSGAFLKFRDMVFQKSSGYGTALTKSGEQVMGKIDAHPNSSSHLSVSKFVAVKSKSHSQNLAPTKERVDMQGLALAARKRKSEVLQADLSKITKKSLGTSVHGQHSAKAGTSTGKFTEHNHNGKHLKQYSRKATSLMSGVKSPILQSDEKLSSQAPLGLFMRFPQGFALPSEAQLKATFIRFGALRTAETRVYRNSASAQVVFKHGYDAEMALKYAKENAIFGQAAVTFRLRHFSNPQAIDTKQDILLFGKDIPSGTSDGGKSPSSKESPKGHHHSWRPQRVDMKQDIASSGKENSGVRADGRISPSTIDRREGQHAATNSLPSNKVEHGRTGSLADPPVTHQLQAIPSPSNSGKAVNLSSFIPNSVTSVNESSGDIQDQMIKLLRQVSVIVSASSVAAEDS